MLNSLLKLHNKNPQKTPLEDFTTEVFVGLLKMEENIKNDFISSFLKLPTEENYRLTTQAHYSLDNDYDCIVDFVIESNNVICFIENKVNSEEGERQLERYGKVLDGYKNEGKTTKLFYCTKYSDKKEYVSHNFDQFRWYEIAKFLKKYEDNGFVNEFIKFLKIYDMAQELTLDAKDFVSLCNLQNIINKMYDYLERVKPLFEKKFINEQKISDGFSMKQLRDYNRLIYYFKEIFSSGGWSELKFGFHFTKLEIYVGIWVDKFNKSYGKFVEYAKQFDIEHKAEIEKGMFIELRKDISIYLNAENAEAEILKWFESAFEKFQEFIKISPDLDWKIKI
jgi:hypothetical protein